MEGQGHPLCFLDQTAVGLHVDSPVFVQASDHYAVGPQLARHLYVGLHALQFQWCVEEVATARTDDDVQACRRQHPARHHDLAIRRRCATFGYSRAQFHTVRASSLGSQATLYAIGANLKPK